MGLDMPATPLVRQDMTRWAAVIAATWLDSGRVVPGISHGTVGGYTYYGCRCRDCRAAGAPDAVQRALDAIMAWDPAAPTPPLVRGRASGRAGDTGPAT